MTREDTSKLADGPGQAIRRLPTGCYELSANLQRPQLTDQSRLPRAGAGLYTGFVPFDEKEAGWKVDRSILVVSVVALFGFGGLAALSTKMVGTPELPTETQSAVPVSTAAAPRPENNHASTEALERGGVGDSTAPTKVAKPTSTLPREWLIENLAAAARDARLRKQAALSPASTTAAAAARAEVPVGSRSPDDGGRGPEAAVGAAGKSPGLGMDDPQTSELQSPPISGMRMDKRRIYAHHTARRGTIKSARRKGGYGLYWNGFFRPWTFW